MPVVTANSSPGPSPGPQTPAAARPAPAPSHAAVYALFFATGISGLMYQVVWLRMLARMMGVTIYATSTVLAAFMGGLALGSFIVGRYIDRRRDPLRVYAVLELLVGIAALIVPLILMGAQPLYAAVYGWSGGAAAFVRVVFAVATLLIPTTLMGGTLPVLTAYLTQSQQGFGRSFSTLYGLNTLGAVTGVIASGFFTIGALGEWWTILVGAAINMAVAAAAFALNARATNSTQQEDPRSVQRTTATPLVYSPIVRRAVLISFGLSGFTALAYEVVWTRQLILFLKTSIYAFSGMLAVFLAGVALGSLLINKFIDKLKAPVFVFALLELAVAAISLLNLHLFSPLDSPALLDLMGRGGVVFATVVIVFPLTYLFGMIAPVAFVSFAKGVSRTGASVGGLYSANTTGNILGALAAGFLLIPMLGSTPTVLYLAWGNAAIGFVLLAVEPRIKASQKFFWMAVSIPVFAVLSVNMISTDPFRAVIEQRITDRRGTTWMPDSNAALPKSEHVYFHREGIEGTVTAFEVNRFKQLWVNGQGMTFLLTEAKVMAYLPLAMTKEPKHFLAIAFGMGTATRSAVKAEASGLYPGLDVTAVDLVPETFETFKYYHTDGDQILAQPNVHAVVNDGRNHLLLARTLYDVISVDPAPPIYSAGTVNLYTREFFELAKSRLTENGVFCLWFPTGTREEVHSMMRTFQSVFPNGTVWSGTHDWGYYFVGPKNDIDWPHLRKEIARIYSNPVAYADLTEFDRSAGSADDMLQLLMWKGPEIPRVARDGVLITDNFPYTEFPLWRYLRDGAPGWHPRSAWLPPSQRIVNVPTHQADLTAQYR